MPERNARWTDACSRALDATRTQSRIATIYLQQHVLPEQPASYLFELELLYWVLEVWHAHRVRMNAVFISLWLHHSFILP